MPKWIPWVLKVCLNGIPLTESCRPLRNVSDYHPQEPHPREDRSFTAPWCPGPPPEKSRSRDTSRHARMLWGAFENKVSVTAGISCVSCCWLQLSHGRQVTSSTGLTVLSSKARLGPCHRGGGTCHFLPKASAAQVHSCPSWVEFHCHYLDSHQERSRSFPKVQDNPI